MFTAEAVKSIPVNDLQRGASSCAWLPCPTPTSSTIFVSELVKRDYRVEWYPQPWEKASRGREKPPIDLVEIGFGARIRSNGFPPINSASGRLPTTTCWQPAIFCAVRGRAAPGSGPSNPTALFSNSILNRALIGCVSARCHCAASLACSAGLGIQPVLQGGRMRHGDDVVP